MGQANPTKVLTEKDYGLWGRLIIGKMNTTGSWISWRMRYDQGSDTLYVGKTSGKGSYRSFADATNESFVGHSRFAYLSPERTLCVLSLENGKEWTRKTVSSFQSYDRYRLMLLQYAHGNDLSHIEIVDSEGKNKIEVGNVQFVIPDPTENHVALIINEMGTSRCEVIDLQNLKIQTVLRTTGKFESPVWDRTGRFLALAQSGSTPRENRLHSYDKSTRSLSTLEGSTNNLFSTGRRMGTSGMLQLSISENGKTVLFNTTGEKKFKIESSPLVEIWNTSDKLLYPAQSVIDTAPEILLAQWNTITGDTYLVADTATPSASPTGMMDFAVASDPLAYEPQFERDGPTDLYLVDLKWRTRKRWLQKRALKSIFPLVASNMMLYREEGWKLFNPETSIVMDCHIPTDSISSDKLAMRLMPASDATGSFLLMPDGADIWKISTATGQKTRLTYGREKGLVYMLPEKSGGSVSNYGMMFLPSFDLSKPLALRIKNKEGNFTGYSLLMPNGNLKNIAFQTVGHSDIVSDATGYRFGYITESFDKPRTLNIFYNGKVKEIFASNPHQKEYLLGKAKLIHYRVGGQEMDGILYYPYGIDRNKKHPMVTHIYEIQSDRLYRSAHPSFINGAGFNVANLVGKGYFVLLPDIRHTLGNPGKDASESLNAVLDQILQDYPVDPSRLGLVGHSFGGYETAAVIGYTNRFATAIMGAGMSDAVSFYLTANRNNRKPNYWRYESGQSRIGKSLFEDPQAYFDNSPILAASKINTPLLIWTGSLDTQVPPEQSYSMHLALRRLGKKSTMLVYPHEGHSFLIPESNRDLTLRIEQWLDHFLKDSHFDWIK